MDYRIFTLNNELCIIHYPKKPNGFGVLIIGGEEQYVDEGKSNWLSNYNRLTILQSLMDEGYTVFYSNFGRKHMGNDWAKEQVNNLYEYIKRTEILNEKVHIIAEGMGALVAAEILSEKREMIRSLVFINPIFTLSWLINLYEDQPFLYKKTLQEISQAYELNEEQCEEMIKENKEDPIFIKHPFIIIHILEHGLKDSEWIQLYRNYFNEQKEKIYVILPDKRNRIFHYTRHLFKEAEKYL